MRVRRAFHTLKGSGRVVGARRIGDFAWSIENLLNRLIDGTLERNAAMLATLREGIALLPALVGELEGRTGEVAGVDALAARAEAHASGTRAAAAVPREAAAASTEPTQVLAKLDEEAMAKHAGAPPEAPAAPAEEPAVAEADDAWLGRPAAYAEGGDSSLQEIYKKEVQSHLEVIRAYLRHAWLAVGTHTVTEDLYRACHTLRGASRTAGIRHSMRLAEPLHRWLRRMFDHDAPFDEAGLAVLADCVVGFEDVLGAVHEDTGHFTNIDRLIKRIDQQDAALERRLAEEPPQMDVSVDIVMETPAEPAPVEPAAPEAPPRLSLETLVPGRVASTVAPERDVHGVLPKAPGAAGTEGRPPYLESADAESAAATTPAPVQELPSTPSQPASPAHSEDYDPDVAAIFSEEATELLESADAALGALKAERGSRERVTELQRVLHTLKGGARMAGITAMGDLSHELESLVIHVGDNTVDLDQRSLEVLQSSLDELNRMRDYVSAGRPVAHARDLITRIRLVGRGGAPEAAKPAAAAAAPSAPVAPPVAKPEPAPAPVVQAAPAPPQPEHRNRSRKPKSRPKRKNRLPPGRRRRPPRLRRRPARRRPTVPRSRASMRTCSTTC